MEDGLRRGDISPIEAWLGDLYARCKDITDGSVASYIPELAKANPNHFGICLVTADGKPYAVGDCDTSFTIQSISKAFVFGLALQDHGRDHVLSKVGVEPTGEAFNSIVFDEQRNRPFNPMVNAGAIATTALVKGEGLKSRFDRILRFIEGFTGHVLQVDNDVFHSEKTTGHRNRAIAHLELNFGMIDERVEEHLDLYFMQCSILVTARDLGIMAATLANGGVNPITGLRALDERYVKYVIAVMSTCGMYDYAGEWLYRVGLPAKSGVGGGIVAVLPGQLGIGTFSPALDEHGNSLRGIKVCEDLSESFGLHMLDVPNAVRSAVARHYRGDTFSSERVRSTADRALLEAEGSAIVVYELHGDLIVASAEQLIRRLIDDVLPCKFIILDCKRVWRIHRAAAALLQQTVAAQALLGRTVLFAGLSRYGALSRNSGLREALIASGAGSRETFFDTLDEALEWAEDRILAAREDRPKEHEPLALSQMELLAGLSPAQMTALGKIIEPMRYPAGHVIFEEGDDADRLYLLAAGRASIFVSPSDSATIRLAGISAGATFGEMAAFDGKRRSAGVRADTEILTYALGVAAFAELQKTNPTIYNAIISNLVRVLSSRLRRADAKIKALE